MILLPFLTVLALAGATPGVAAPPDDAATTEKQQAQFKLFLQRSLEKQKAAAAGGAVAPAPGTVLPGHPPAPPPWKQEQERAVAFNKEFGPGAYEGITGFSDRCLYKDGCDKLATMSLIDGAYKFVELQKDVENKTVTEDSSAYRGRHEQIKTGMKTAMDGFRPRPGGSASYEADFIKSTDPIVTKVFTKDELLKYAERNAASADSAPFYTFLGKTLNGAGPAGKAREAFDAALQRDPKNEAALSGRAEASLNLGDYPGAVSDARAALTLNPGDERALATLKFAEGRLPAGSSAGSAGPGADAAAGGVGTAGAAYPAGSAQAALGRAGDVSAQDAARRSEEYVAAARRSLTLGDARAAAESLRKAVELNPSNAEALSLSAMAHIRLKDYAQALAAAEAGLQLAPNNAALLDAKAQALNYMKDYKGALASADLAIAANPNDPMAYFNRAWALGGLHERAGSLDALQSAARLNPQFASVRDSALRLPQDSDILYLFPGEAPGAQPAPADVPAAVAGLSPRLMLGGGLLAGLLLAAIVGLRLRRPAAPPPLASVRQAPELLAGKYEVGSEIGSGGMGVVYKGRDRSLDRAVAIKRMREEIRWDPRERARFVAEAKLVAKLKHPHIVEIHAIVEEDGEVYLIFEHIAGRTLHQIIAQEKKLPFETARDLFRGVASALDYAQSLGVIHRDLKPANVMVDAEGRVRVMDFGIARLTEEAISRHSKTNTVVGTPLYMAPEQEQGVARKESDAYSMAVCLYEVLTGLRPFAGTGSGLLMNKLKKAYEPPSAVAARMPPGLDEVFAKALDPDPDQRYATAGALVRALEALETPRAA